MDFWCDLYLNLQCFQDVIFDMRKTYYSVRNTQHSANRKSRPGNIVNPNTNHIKIHEKSQPRKRFVFEFTILSERDFRFAEC